MTLTNNDEPGYTDYETEHCDMRSVANDTPESQFEQTSTLFSTHCTVNQAELCKECYKAMVYLLWYTAVETKFLIRPDHQQIHC